MNRKTGMYSSIVNLISIMGFAISMLIGFNPGSYFCSMFIAFSFVTMMCGYAYFSEKSCRLAGYAAAAFACIYATIILLVYFAQLTTVRLDDLNRQAVSLLDFHQFGLLFNYDMMGYALMALSTFFAGLTISPKSNADKWLKYLLMIHGIFFASCISIPMLGIFRADGPAWVGVAILTFWCVYFCPVSILSFLHFQKCRENL